MKTYLIQGASRGIGAEIVRQLLSRGDTHVIATCRNPQTPTERSPHLTTLKLDVTKEADIERAAREVKETVGAIDVLLNVSGVLHAEGMRPERRFEDLTVDAMQRAFAVHAVGPAMMAKHFIPLFREDAPVVFASISAKIGSIEDNGIGGWYTYRSTKAAQNQLTKTLSIELKRRNSNATVLALHPGTVDTDLSKPFQRSVPDDKLFTRERAARQLLDIIDKARPSETGSFYSWDGSKIPW